MSGKKIHPLVWVALGCGGLMFMSMIVSAILAYFVWDKAKDVVQEFEANPEVATAKMISAFNPDLEFVESDEANQTVTFKDHNTGENVTLDFADIRQGNLEALDPDGNMQFKITRSSEGQFYIEDASGDVMKATMKDGKVEVVNEAGETNTFNVGSSQETEEKTFKPRKRLPKISGLNNGKDLNQEEPEAESEDEDHDRGYLPDWVPSYPTAMAGANLSGVRRGAQSGAFTLKTKDAPTDVRQWYRSWLSKHNYTIDLDMNNETNGIRTYALGASGDGVEISVSINNDHDGSTRITTTYKNLR